MDVIPAIDLRDGKCVRLIQGQYDRQITYRDDPVAQAQEFHRAGARRLHVVDLDGARLGHGVNAEAVRAIVEAVDMTVELGGGVRSEEDIRLVLDMGVDYAILGSAAVRRWEWFTEMVQKYEGRLILGLDARGAKVSVEGWTAQSSRGLWDVAAQAGRLPLAALIYTDISKDGMLAGPNVERTRQLVEQVPVPVICAGGVTEVDDIVRLKEIGVAGAIIGRALYEGRIDLERALAAAR